MRLDRLKIWVPLILVLTLPTEAGAVTALKKLQAEGSRLELIFDGKMAKNQIKVDYLGDTIQLSLSDVSVYPAKIFSVNSSEMTKVFAYQYAPKLVRTRLTMKSNAEDYRSRLQIIPTGKSVIVKITGLASDSVAVSAAAAARAPLGGDVNRSAGSSQSGGHSPAAQVRVHASAAPAEAMNSDEKVLLDRVLKDSAPSEKRADRESLSIERASNERTLTGNKPAPSLARGLGMLLLVVGIFAALALLFRKYAGRLTGGAPSAALFKKLVPSLSGKSRMIEVVQSHYLGPKKSIAVVRVGGKVLVVGITEESINLITQLSPSSPAEEANAVEADALESLIDQRASDMGLEEFLAEDRRKPPAREVRIKQPAADPRMLQPASVLNAPVIGARQAIAAQYGAGATSGAQRGGVGATAAGQPVFADILNSERAKPSVRDQIKSRVEGLKPL